MKTMTTLLGTLILAGMVNSQVILQQQTTTTTTTTQPRTFINPGMLQQPGVIQQPGVNVQFWTQPGMILQDPFAQPVGQFFTDPLTGMMYYTDPMQGQFMIDQWGNYIPVQQQIILQQPVTQPQFMVPQQQFFQQQQVFPQQQFIAPQQQFIQQPAFVGVDGGTFSMMIQQISQQSFDSNRLQLAMQIVSSNRLTSAQVTDIARLLSFESSRLDFLKFAYPFVADPGSYFMVNNAFSFSSSVDELNRHIMGFR